MTSLGEKSEEVVLADLKAGSTDLTAKNDVITLDDVTTTLTAAGAKAFGGFYETGATLDPLNLTVALTDDADLPSDDPSSTTGTGSSDNSGTTGSTSGGVTGSTTGSTTGSLASTGSGIPATALGTAAAVTVAAGAGVVFAMRRRRTEA
ncbi:HtaA domain-containing protein [Streptomyces hokutonensis]|uniref:HtaA domain-containing protein n=1 Tax=Streptomyces hokutonensis TaxID=1306990 RepID=UPI00035D4C73|nr:HtaA domain-containing protein [Streptomyces hokutonensis]